MTHRYPRLPTVLPLLLLATAGCSSDAAISAWPDDGGVDSGSIGELPVLRMDVFPSDATPGLLPQTITLDEGPDWSRLEVEVRPTVSITGRVTGFEATPYAVEPTVPGEEDVPVAARIDVRQPGSVAGATTSTDEDGDFALQVPAGEGYQLVVVPEESTRLPFEVRTILLLASDLDLSDLYLDYGAPVWGQVTRSDGAPVSDVTVHLVEAGTDAVGPVAEVDDEGWYLLRAYPGEYELVVTGEDGASDPTRRQPFSFESEDGLQVDADLGPLERLRMEGSLVDKDGQSLGALDRFVVRMTAISLDEVEGELQVETSADQYGSFELDLMAGEYLLEVIPEYDAGRSPVARPVTISGTDLDLGDITVPERVPWSVQVLGPDGSPASNALVVAREIGFDGYTYSATAGADGLLTMELPDTPVELTITPSDASAAITHITYDPASAQAELHLSAGTPLSGTLSTEGEPVSYALIEIRDEDGRLYGTTVSDGDGAFALRVESDPALLP